MIEKQVIVTTAHGEMPAFAAHPSGPGPWPGIIFYMDARGMRTEIHNMAKRIAKRGYYCLAPDLYYRLGTIRFDSVRREETMSAVVRACVAHVVNSKQITEDTAAMLGFLDSEEHVKAGPVGAVGHCMGGPFITWAAARFPHRIKAAASLYGIRLVSEEADSPHAEVAKCQGELYYGFAERDNSAPPETVAALREALSKASVASTVDVFPNTDHGFCFAERSVYSHEAAETAWEKVFDMWERNLR